MHRRARHFNPAHADGVKGGICIDSRFIVGVASGAALSTWQSRAGASAVFSQGTGARQPIYLAGAVGGQPAVVFTAANQQWMIMDINSPIGSADTQWHFFSVTGSATGSYSQGNTSSSVRIGYIGAVQNNYGIQLLDGLAGIDTVNTGNTQVNVFTAPLTGVMSSGRDGSNLYALTSPSNTRATVAAQTFRTLTPSGFALYYSTYLSALSLFIGQITDSLRNRIMQHYAMSFKRAM